MKSNKIKTFIENLYPCQVGFVKARVFDELKPSLLMSKSLGYDSGLIKEEIDVRIDPFKIYEEVKTLIVAIFPYTHKDMNLMSKKAVISRSSWGYDYHNVLKEKLKTVQEYLKKEFNSDSIVLVDNHPLHDRHIAYLAGLGNYGKNTLLINKKYGSYFFISLILTNLELESYEYNEPNDEDICKDCNRCLKACPTQAISENRMLNSNKCMSFITQLKEEMDDEYLSKFKKNTFGCDFCQMACVYNSNIEEQVLDEFKPNGKEVIKIKDLYNLSNKEFNKKYKDIAAGFRGKNVLLRNAILVAVNNKDIEDLKHIKEIKVNNQKYLVQAINYAKNKIDEGE